MALSALSDVFKSTVNRRNITKSLQSLFPFLEELSASFSDTALSLASVEALKTKNVPAPITKLTVRGYTVDGDAAPFSFRRAIAAEYTIPGVITSADGSKWIISESVLYPEWFGAKGDGTGASGVGNDDAPAFRDMLATASALKITARTRPGKGYRFASHTQHPGGQKTVLLLGSDTNFEITSRLYHDSYDPTAGSPMFIFTAGTKSNRTKRIHIRFENHGCLVFPSDGVRPRRADDAQGNPVYARKGSMAFYYTDYFSIVRSSTSGLSPTGFQTTCYHSSYGLVDGGFIGYPDMPSEAGDDGFHVIGSCSNIIARGLLINSGDDSISLTCETNMDGEKLERITISDCICTTWQAKVIKIHITGVDQTATSTDKTKNCVIQDINISNITGSVRSDTVGAAIVILNENRAANNIVRRIRIDNVNLDTGPVPKQKPNAGTENGHAVLVSRCDDVVITNSTINGASTGNLLYYSCNGGSVSKTTLLTKPEAVPTLIPSLSITSYVSTGSYRRITFSGAPDLQSIVDALAVRTTASLLGDNRYPILNVTGMGATLQNGSYIIRAVDNTNKWVDVENFRSGVADEASGSTGTATVTLALAPAAAIVDCVGTTVEASVVAPRGWTAGFLGGRQSQSDRCEMNLTVTDAIYGYGIYTTQSTQNRISMVAKNCKSGSYMIRVTQTSITNPLNHILNSTDMAGLSEVVVGVVGMGYARTLLTDYATDRVDVVRGRQSTRVSGSVNQVSGSTTFSIVGMNVGGYAGYTTPSVTAAHVAKLIPTTAGVSILSITWDQTNAKFDIVTASAPTAQVTWQYTIQPPN